MIRRSFLLATIVACVATGFAAPALAASEPTTRLIACSSGSCLLVSGRRDSAATIIEINGHAIAVGNQRHWQVRLPLATLRSWSEPQARTIAVAVIDPATEVRTEQDVHLPIGLLGHADIDTLALK